MTALRSPRMILIDVDGTMADSVPDLAYCVDQMMQALDRLPHGEARVRNWVGNGVELYAANTSKRSRLYPGVREGLDWLRAAGVQIVGVSYGYNHGVDIRTAHPDAVIDSLLQLRGLLPSRAAGSKSGEAAA